MNTIPSPVKQDDNTNRQYLGEWCGNLYSVYWIGKSKETRFQVFEWDKDSSKWFEKYSVSASKIFSEFPSAVREVKGNLSEYPTAVREEMRKLTYNYHILAVMSGDGREEPAIVLAIRGAIISYNFVLDTVQMLLVIPELQSYVSQLGAFPFMGTFCPTSPWTSGHS
ncbi:hypothetical protein LIER_00084 [Lithospermum erythrorhizon]|uniref:Uncharacterized protein n=1 Tax=Lithospermum erythrorhizon TaxID=34254 RepID=A0AAV3NKM7_LITER